MDPGGSMDAADAEQLPRAAPLGEAVASGDYAGCVAALLQELDLGPNSELDILPFLSGVLMEAVSDDAHDTPPKQRKGAFSRQAATHGGGRGGPSQIGEAELWSRMLRGAFSADAAAMLQRSLLDIYSSDDLEVPNSLLSQFGFQGGSRGQEAMSAAIQTHIADTQVAAYDGGIREVLARNAPPGYEPETSEIGAAAGSQGQAHMAAAIQTRTADTQGAAYDQQVPEALARKRPPATGFFDDLEKRVISAVTAHDEQVQEAFASRAPPATGPGGELEAGEIAAAERSRGQADMATAIQRHIASTQDVPHNEQVHEAPARGAPPATESSDELETSDIAAACSLGRQSDLVATTQAHIANKHVAECDELIREALARSALSATESGDTRETSDFAAGDACDEQVWEASVRYVPSATRPGDELETSEIAAAYAEAVGDCGLPADALWAEAAAQARVLATLGIGRTSVEGQQPLPPEDAARTLAAGAGSEAAAERLFQRNAFDISLFPAVASLSAADAWPPAPVSVGGGPRRLQAGAAAFQCGEIPTLELCAAICTRIVCCADRLMAAGEMQLLFLGVGSRDALVQACVVQYLAVILGQEIDLNGRPPFSIKYAENFDLLIVATDDFSRRPENAPDVAPKMSVIPYDAQEAVLDFASQNLHMIVFACWPPEEPGYLKDIEAAAGQYLAEICLLQPPQALRGRSPTALQMPKLRMTELFPKTLCCYDFFAEGFECGESAGLHHSQLYVFTPFRVPPPFLVPQLTHALGSYTARIVADRRLEGVGLFRRIGLTHVRSPEDLFRPLPTAVLDSLRESLYGRAAGAEEAHQLRCRLVEALGFAEGQCHKQLDILVESSAHQEPTGEERAISIDT